MSTVTHSTYDVLEQSERVESASRFRLSPRAAWAAASLSIDVGMLAAAAAMAELGSPAAGVAPVPVGWWIGFGLLMIGFCAVRRVYAWHSTLSALDDVRIAVSATALAAMSIVALRGLFGSPPDLAPQMIRLWAFATVYVAAGRVVFNCWQAQARRHGELVRPTLIVGAGKVGQLAAKRLLEHPERGLRPVGFLDKEPLEPDGLLPVLGASWDLDRVVAEHDVQQVIVTFSTAPSEVLLRLVKRCEELGVEVFFVPRLFEKMTERLSIEHLGGLPFVTARAVDPKGLQFAVKYTLDRVLAAVGLLCVLPIFAATALAVWISLGRPIFFRQRRIGRDGRPFEMLKFRSMKLCGPAEVGESAVEVSAHMGPGGVEGADRRTRVGSFLRCTSVDELPQLLNVLKGEMSVVGPRPERPEFVDLFEETVHRYGERHRVKAGITGWAQVHGLRGKTSIADRAEWDNYYIENWSLWLDLKITLLTVLAVFRCFGQVE